MDDGKWEVKTKSENDVLKVDKFDNVMLCNGHYELPMGPKLEGAESFPGQIIHSHNYRKPEDIQGQRVVLLGAASSGEDIARDVS